MLDQTIDIDEMLRWLSDAENDRYRANESDKMETAIRAILEQHRNIFERTPSFFELVGYSIEEIQCILERHQQDDADLERYAVSAFIDRVHQHADRLGKRDSALSHSDRLSEAFLVQHSLMLHEGDE